MGIPTGADTDISKIAGNLATLIQEKIGGLQADFERATSIKSSIEPPHEFAALFQSFSVSTGSGEERVSLDLRGDGIQARYVSSVLQYISKSSNDFFIWGFEEPENSLEYTHTVELADDFVTLYSENAQIFLTTHSPAFTSIHHEKNTCYRVYQRDGKSEVAQVWPEADDILQESALNKELGLMQIHVGIHREYVKQGEQLKEMQDSVRNLVQEIQKAQKPLVLVEGKTDKKILETAWHKLRPNSEIQIIIRDADTTGGAISGGAGGADALAKMIESIHPEGGIRAVAVFDRDQKGVRNFGQLTKNFSSWKGHMDIKVHKNEIAFALLLPIPPG